LGEEERTDFVLKRDDVLDFVGSQVNLNYSKEKMRIEERSFVSTNSGFRYY